jgi:hypothetical protein
MSKGSENTEFDKMWVSTVLAYLEAICCHLYLRTEKKDFVIKHFHKKQTT